MNGLMLKFRGLVISSILLTLLTGCGGGSGGGSSDGGSNSSSSVPAAPSALSYFSPQIFSVSTPIVALNPAVTGAVASYSVSPALPAGLTLDTTTGQISGTPTTAAAASNYTITAANVTGSTSFNLSITVDLQLASTTDLQVTNSGVVDPEFDAYSNRYSYCEQSITQSTGTLWVGTFYSHGSFDDYAAHPGTPVDDCLFQINGPEWGRDSSGAVLTYVKNDSQGNPTLAYAHEDSPGNWSVHTVPNLPQLTASYNAIYPSDTLSNAARVLFVSMAGIEWRDLGGGVVPGSGGGLVTSEQGFPRWATQSNYIAFIQTTGTPAIKQLFVFNTDDGTATQISNSAGDKNNPHMWVDANLGMVVTGAVGSNYEVWQLSSKTRQLVIPSPNGMPMQSPEHFVYQGRSYIYYFVQNDALDGTKNDDVYLTLIDSNYSHLKVSGTQLMSRIEPEVAFPSSGTPIIYFSSKGSDGKNNAVWRSAVIGLPQ